MCVSHPQILGVVFVTTVGERSTDDAEAQLRDGDSDYYLWLSQYVELVVQDYHQHVQTRTLAGVEPAHWESRGVSHFGGEAMCEIGWSWEQLAELEAAAEGEWSAVGEAVRCCVGGWGSSLGAAVRYLWCLKHLLWTV